MRIQANVPPVTSIQIPSRFLGLFLALLLTVPALAKDAPQVIDWPVTGTPVLRFTFSKFKQLDGASSSLLGKDFISMNDVGAGESVKVESTVSASGTPASVTIKDSAQNPKTVSLTVNSIPQGAVVQLDQTEMGTTPKIIRAGVGKHILTFTKEGFTEGTYPLEIGPQDVSGGSVSYELGTSAFDSIELRDGSVLNDDLVSISGMDVEIRVGGVIQHIDGNKIKRAMFVQRSAPLPNLPGPVPPSP